MPIKYFKAPDVEKMVNDIIQSLGFLYVVPQYVYCYRSIGSKSRRTIARIHGFTRIWQDALQLPPAYIIEVISERYDKLTKEQKEKTLIHELLHIPNQFSGGFRPHKGYIDQKKVECLYQKWLKQKLSKNGQASNMLNIYR